MIIKKKNRKMFIVSDLVSLKQETPEASTTCVIDLVSDRDSTIILIDRSVMEPACLFDTCLLVPFHSMTKNLCYYRNFSVI